MSLNAWDRLKAGLRSSYDRSFLAHYGAGLECDCGDCPVGPSELPIPAPRRQSVSGPVSAEPVDGGGHPAQVS